MDNKKIEIKEDNIIFELEAENAEDAIKALTKTLLITENINDEKHFFEAVLKRENEIPTSIGNEIAIPHGKSHSVVTPAIALAVLKNEIIWNEESEDKVKYVFLLAISDSDKGDEHLRTLANLSSRLLDDEFVGGFKLAKNKQQVVNAVNIEE